MVRIAIIGAGLMGVKMAGELAYHGNRVKIFDISIANLDKVNDILDDDKKQLYEDGLLPQKNFVGQVFCMSRLEETVKDAELILETVCENLQIKQDIFERISHCCKEDAIIASNTLRLEMDDINERTHMKERTLSLRFLFPVYCIPEVEIQTAKETSQEVVEKVRKILEKMGKTLFFRSGGQPLVLSEVQRDDRKKARLEEICNSSLTGTRQERTVPNLLHRGNINSTKIQDEVASIIPSDLDRECAICMFKARDCLLSPCHHMVTCFTCGNMLQTRHDACPICRRDIKETIRVFHT